MTLPQELANKVPLKAKRFGRFRRRISRLHLKQGIKILPNLFTLGNAFFGFCSLIFAAHGDAVAAAYFILLGALMDGLDGRIARMAKVTSELGMQLDSLSDAVSFCVAPAFLLYMWQLHKLGWLGLAACGCFVMAGLLRLARFNLTSTQQSINFIGVTTTLSTCFFTALVLNLASYRLNSLSLFGLVALLFLFSFLMLSSIPFPSFKQLSKKVYRRAAVVCLVFVVTMGFTRVLLLLFITYLCYALTLAAYNKIKQMYLL
jgi:CDP-diacylglycerol---serine O-phosphatidyltransferase